MLVPLNIWVQNLQLLQKTSEPHNLSNGDQVTLSLNLQAVSITKTFKVRVSDYQTITYTKPSVTTTLVTDVALMLL